MGIIQDLQAEIINADADIITILRKALLVSHKLKLTEFEKWIKNELNGYNSVDNLPEYRRKIKGSLKFRNPYYGLCSIQCETKNFEDLLTRKNITDSIPKLLSLIKDNNSILIMELPPELVQQLWQSNNSALQFEIFLVFDKSIFSNILKIMGVGYLAEFANNICIDGDCKSIGAKIIFAGKIAIMILALPIIKTLVNLIAEILP